MSKGTVRSKTPNIRSGSSPRRILGRTNKNLKPFGFCCSIDNFDPLTKYDQRKLFNKSSSLSVTALNESPVLKFRTQFSDYFDADQIHKNLKSKVPDIGDQKRKTQTNQKQIFPKSQNLRKLNESHDNLHKLRNQKRNIFKRYKRTSHSSQNIRKLYKSRNSYDKQYNTGDLYDTQVVSPSRSHRLGPLQWYLEDEIATAKDIIWKERQDMYNEEVERNIRIGKEKSMRFQKDEIDKYPRWYQDFSIDQVRNLMTLQSVIHKDCEEMVTGRTQRTLTTIGIISTFFNPTSDVIRKLQESSNCNVIDFLREMYKTLTGNYFEEEGYKRFYDCNERIILSAIAFLTLPEAVIELHNRLPPVVVPKLPPKPMPPVIPMRRKMASPYEEELFTRPDWASYYNNLQHWRMQYELIAVPKIILPPKECVLTSYNSMKLSYDNGETIRSKLQNFSQNHQLSNIKSNPPIQAEQKYINTKEKYKEQEKNTRNNPSVLAEQKRVFTKEEYKEQKQNISTNLKQKYSAPVKTEGEVSISSPAGEKQKSSVPTKKKHKTEIDATDNRDDTEEEVINESQELALDIPELPDKSKVFDFTINGISDTPGPVEYKICGILQPPQTNKKSWLGEKHAHYVISGAPNEPPTCPVTYEMTGVANVTPTNSNERFFAVLKLGDGPKKIYPSGRENLSPKWQEWLQNADEEFRKVDSEANKMIKSIEAITRLVFPGPTCDSCCSCRQTRKSYLKAKETKTPYLVIDTLTEDDKKNKYIVGSMAMHSPAPTPPESTVNLLEYIASEDVLTTNVLINGVTDEKGNTQYFISGFKKDMVRRPGRVVERPPPRPPRNVPPCVCAIQHIFTKGLTSKISHDHIPWTKEDGLCFGEKFRPNESPAYSCKLYPGDKSCRRNPFMHEINKLKRRVEREKEKREEAASPKEKKMYSIADFQPCGDEHGMSICGGPWGALHTLTPEELAEQERIRKEILRGPPCGIKPGRAVCEGPFGERIPTKRPQIEIEEVDIGEGGEDLEDEEEETEEEEEEVQPAPVVEEKKKERKRHKQCYMSPESIAGRKKVVTKKVEKFIPDPTYPGYDDPWNIFRTAPSEKESETDFKTLLKLSTPEPRATSVALKALVDESEKSEQSPSQKDVSSKSPSKKDSSRVPIKYSKKTSLDRTRSTSTRLAKHVPEKSKSDSKIKQKERKKSKPIDKIGTREIFSKSSRTSMKTKGTLDKATQDKKTDKPEDQKSLKSKESKHSQKMVNERSMSPKYLEKGSKSPQITRTKSTDENILSKSKRKRTYSSQKTLSKKFDSKIKQSETTTSRKSKNSDARINKETVSRRNRVNKKFEKGLESSLHIETNKQNREGKRRKKSHRKRSSSVHTGRRKRSKVLQSKKKHTKQDRKKDVQIVQDKDLTPQEQIQKLKNMMKSDMYPYNVKPVELPDEVPAKCTVEYEDEEDAKGSVQADEEEDAQLPSKGPCGWRTKSEQQLRTKKTLAYLAEPDYPAETIPVRPGGKPCVCRENRAKKKLLLYNIGGLIGGKMDDAEAATKKKLLKKKKSEDKQHQVIDGLIYYTPPPSPRRSDEYVPEYDLYESPYDMCQTRRKDENLKLFEEYSGPKSLISKVLKRNEPCDCNEYIDTYGIQTSNQSNEEEQTTKEFDKARQDLIESKPPKERWKLALKDVGLINYYARCRDSLPCWLKCAKFNKVGCRLPYRKLKVKRPVCECKYERKILEHKEEKRKYKERRQRLQSLEKQPFVNVENISRPVVADTKLMISGVKRIPREDEYVDDVKYCITGVAENYTTLPPKQIVDGVQMATPLQTPEESVAEIPCVCLHQHWSPVNIPPGPLPKPEEILLAEKRRRQKAAEEAYQQIYAPQEVYDTHDGHSCKATCDQNSDTENDENTEENKEYSENVTSHRQKIVKNNQTKKRAMSPPKRIKQQIKLSNVNEDGLNTKGVMAQKVLETTKKIVINSPKQMKQQLKLRNVNEDGLDTKNVMAQKVLETTVKNPPKKNKSVKNEVVVQKISDNPQGSKYKEIENINFSPRYSQNEVVKSDTGNVEITDAERNESLNDTNVNITIMVQVELKKMASEGFLFAKLPKCFLMPQLQYWLMYRKGLTLTDKDKENSLHRSTMIWNILDVKGPPRAEPSPFKMTKLELRKLTFDRAEEMKEKITKKKEIFYSQLRKERVLYSRSMWNTMDYGKFPSTSFKRTYFTYMPSKEADGHVFKPWHSFEIREMVN